MKKYCIVFLLFILLIGGCSIKYSSNIEGGPDNSEIEPSNPPSEESPDNSEDGEDSTETETDPSLSSPDIIDPITIDETALFYPATLTSSSEIINKYSYVYSAKKTQYKIYSAYYSSYYDTLYIAYDNTLDSSQTLKAKDLYQMERHLLNYYSTDNNKTDYKDYLKAVLIYPDTFASSCRDSITSDSQTKTINGCANYVGKEAIISLNRMTSINNFYNEQKEYITATTYYQIEAVRYTYAHEFGHVSTFFNMAYKGDEDYEDYLKLRLGESYNTIYPNGLPTYYSSQTNSYYTQPAEILADDYVELFYNRTKKATEDTRDYNLNTEYHRNSLRDYPDLQNLKDNDALLTYLKNYYTDNFLDYSLKTTYQKPKVISSNSRHIAYYESYSQIGKEANIKNIVSLIQVNLIAVGEVTVNGTKYYRVILSNTFNTSTTNHYDEKEVGKKMGYVLASSYTDNQNIKIYKINKDLEKNQMATICNSDSSKNDYTYFLPFYDFSYVLNTTNDNNFATTYDYLNPEFSNTHTYKINIYSFGNSLK